MIDALNSPFKEQAYARAEMLKYAAEQNQSGQSIAVVALTDRLHVLQQFTSDPHVLLAAIKNFTPQAQILQPMPPPAESSIPIDMAGPGRPRWRSRRPSSRWQASPIFRSGMTWSAAP